MPVHNGKTVSVRERGKFTFKTEIISRRSCFVHIIKEHMNQMGRNHADIFIRNHVCMAGAEEPGPVCTGGRVFSLSSIRVADQKAKKEKKINIRSITHEKKSALLFDG